MKWIVAAIALGVLVPGCTDQPLCRPTGTASWTQGGLYEALENGTTASFEVGSGSNDYQKVAFGNDFGKYHSQVRFTVEDTGHVEASVTNLGEPAEKAFKSIVRDGFGELHLPEPQIANVTIRHPNCPM